MMELDILSLLTLPNMLAFLAGGGAAYVALWLMDNVGMLVVLAPERKRYVAYALTAVLAVLFWIVKLIVLNEPMPVDLRDWLITAYAVAAPAVIGNQLLHARLDLRA